MEKVILEVLTEKEAMLKALLDSKLRKSVIGIRSRALGPGTYMTTVVELIVADSGTRVVLTGYDMTGLFLDKSNIALEEIDSVIPFDALFQNPFLRAFQPDENIDRNPTFHRTI